MRSNTVIDPKNQIGVYRPWIFQFKDHDRLYELCSQLKRFTVFSKKDDVGYFNNRFAYNIIIRVNARQKLSM
jgi:hypothetical protein